MTEQQPYTVLEVFRGFELRLYPAHLIVQVTVHSTLEDAGSTAFGYLFGYISGQNTLREDASGDGLPGPGGLPAVSARRIPMTAPVLLQPESLADAYTVAFVLPGSISAATAPEPDDPAVSLVPVPEARGAAAGFTGRWTPHNYLDHAWALGEAVAAAGLTPRGRPRFALFDPPYKPWFLRRNEVVQTVD
ncbi:SOUL family heme-binding protein [Arthrobacter sp. G119Y2]|uniref:SOUL family heme-binding protein n=1 Tax=Arthrobacter sp. G119Y2 TaxID=3134965 RepID=UPI0031193FDA